jgi:transposase-like protein
LCKQLDALPLREVILASNFTEWKRPPREWAEANNQFAVMFNERFVNS